jgi:hypothetical protein
MDKKAFAQVLAQVRRRERNLDQAIQDAGVYALSALAAHGRVDPINQLYVAMPNSPRRVALGQWFLAHGRLLESKKANRDEEPFRVDKRGKNDLEKAAATPWISFKVEKEASPDEPVFDIQAALIALVKRAKKAPRVSDPKQLKELEALAAQVLAARRERSAKATQRGFTGYVHIVQGGLPSLGRRR